MCGIWALLKYRPQLTENIINALNTVKNRGPDSTVIHVDRNYLTCFHRLAINDLSVNGDQPFYYSTSTHNYILMANAEIYNHEDLKLKYDIKTTSTSDCAVLLPLFIKLNEDFKTFNNELRGEYSIVIIKQDKYSDTIKYFMSTDPMSVRPLFYYISFVDYTIGISSLLSGLSSLSENVIRINQGSYIQGETDFTRTFNCYTNYYHKIDDFSLINVLSNERHLYKKIVDVLNDAVKIRLNSDRPLGCLLSGGLDSSLVAAIASRKLKKIGKRLRTFSIGMEGGTDLYYAKKVSEHIDSDHTEYLFTKEEGISVIDEVIKATETYDITTIRASVGQYLLARNIATKTDIKVILNGDGADECQMGYLYFYLSPDLESAIEERNKLLKQIHQFDGLRVDRNISYHGLEARVPYLDKEFVDLYCNICPNLLIPTKNTMEKYLIRKAFQELEPNILPKDVLWRKKEAFSDGVSSVEKSWYLILKDHFNNIISDDEFEDRYDIDGITPICKESYYYRKKFTELYGNNDSVIPNYWLCNWSSSNDPSARTITKNICT
jgi:asparagine synthase (glutamine-hydrolysing)